MSPKPRNQGAQGNSGASTPGVLLNLVQKLKNRKAKAQINAVAVRTQDISVRSMLMRVRSHAKCVGASGLTSNLLCFISSFAISHQTYPQGRHEHTLLFLLSLPICSLLRYSEIPDDHIDVSDRLGHAHRRSIPYSETVVTRSRLCLFDRCHCRLITHNFLPLSHFPNLDRPLRRPSRPRRMHSKEVTPTRRA